MKLFFKKWASLAAKEPDDSKKHLACEERQRFYRHAVQTLLLFIKDFTLDSEELNVRQFKEKIDRLTEEILSEKKTREIESLFETETPGIRSYIDRQNRYVADRETEFKAIINTLTKAIAAFNTENEAFNEKIYQQTEKIEHITRLDDIKAIKDALNSEIEQMRETIREKRTHESEKLKSLSEQVEGLKRELEKKKTDSTRDELTGAYSVQAFDRYIKNLVEQNTGARKPFSLLVLDIDDYAKIQEAYGRQIGDRVTLAIAQACTRFIQGDDFFARYRKGTFIIVFPGKPLRSVSKNAKRLCKSIAANRYYVDDALSGHRLSFTVSIGISAYRKGDTVATVSSRAIQALAAAKRAGKNQVVTEKSRFLLFRKNGVETIEDLEDSYEG